jgi:sensor histidine kinase regulating citrate/malate metabolism
MTNKFISKFIASIVFFILFVFGSIIIGLIALENVERQEKPERQAAIARHIATNAKVKQLLLDGNLAEDETKLEAEHFLQINNLVLDYSDMDEIDKYRTLTIKDSDYRLETIGNQNNWRIACIKKD